MMKTKTILMFALVIFACTFAQSQELPPKHRGMHPKLLADGKVVDENGKQLGYINKDGKICDVTGKVIGKIAESGEVTTANGKGIVGVMQKDGSFKTQKGSVYTTGGDGVVMAAGKEVSKVAAGYPDKSHGCVVHCFYSKDSEEAKEIDENID